MSIPYITLVKESKQPNDIGEYVSTETSRDVFCTKGELSRTEKYNAGQGGLNPSFSVVMPSINYDGERICEYDGKRFHIYDTREYQGNVTLYIEETAGK